MSDEVSDLEVSGETALMIEDSEYGAELRRLRTDAARYRFWRSATVGTLVLSSGIELDLSLAMERAQLEGSESGWDAAIDAARKGEED